ncbi:NAD(P)-dependent oxidoreductase [Umezawaea sp. NPDC059074]|uniref:NAD(P)-dependent oxidoreductase n=1 Tax=Umezawaea sp. NPDC059074 TaxID=3346716 RepID=UPI00368A28A7
MTTSVGFVGIGHMGEPMADRLLDGPWELRVVSRTAAKADRLVARGAKRAWSLADLADCDVVITMLGTDDDLRTVVDGFLAHDRLPGLLVDCSTVSAEVSLEVLARLQERGGDLLAAPVAGGPSVIAGGGLAMIVSGTRSAFDRVRPVLAAMAPRLVHTGPGALSRHVKILHNLVAAVLLHSLAEVGVLAEAAGIHRTDVLDFIGAGALGSRFVDYKAKAMASLDFTPAIAAPLLLKDVDLGLALARTHGVTLDLTPVTRGALARLVEHGHGDLDAAALLLDIAAANGVALDPG